MGADVEGDRHAIRGSEGIWQGRRGGLLVQPQQLLEVRAALLEDVT